MTSDQTPDTETSPPLAEQFDADLAVVRAKVGDFEQQARSFIDQRPVAAVILAAGLGYVLARLVSRAGR